MFCLFCYVFSRLWKLIIRRFRNVTIHLIDSFRGKQASAKRFAVTVSLISLFQMFSFQIEFSVMDVLMKIVTTPHTFVRSGFEEIQCRFSAKFPRQWGFVAIVAAPQKEEPQNSLVIATRHQPIHTKPSRCDYELFENSIKIATIVFRSPIVAWPDVSFRFPTFRLGLRRVAPDGAGGWCWLGLDYCFHRSRKSCSTCARGPVVWRSF